MSASIMQGPIAMGALAGDGAAHGATAAITTSFKSLGSKVRVAGLSGVSIRLAGAITLATSITLRLTDVGSSTNADLNASRELQGTSQKDTSATKAEFSFTTATFADEVFFSLGGVVETIQVEAEAAGNGGVYGAGDWVTAELRFLTETAA